jgi:hypothetical protein
MSSLADMAIRTVRATSAIVLRWIDIALRTDGASAAVTEVASASPFNTGIRAGFFVAATLMAEAALAQDSVILVRPPQAAPLDVYQSQRSTKNMATWISDRIRGAAEEVQYGLVLSDVRDRVDQMAGQVAEGETIVVQISQYVRSGPVEDFKLQDVPVVIGKGSDVEAVIRDYHSRPNLRPTRTFWGSGWRNTGETYYYTATKTNGVMVLSSRFNVQIDLNSVKVRDAGMQKAIDQLYQRRLKALPPSLRGPIETPERERDIEHSEMGERLREREHEDREIEDREMEHDREDTEPPEREDRDDDRDNEGPELHGPA